MIGKVAKIMIPLVVCFFILSVYSSCCSLLTSSLLRWGEIVVVISLFAGLFQFVYRETVKIRSLNKDTFYSAVTVFAFICTFLAGVINFGSEKFAFNNIVREQPGYLVEVTRIVIEDDSYLRRFPAKKKLALLVASRISSHFVPTDEMLKSSNMSMDDYKKLVNPGGFQDAAGKILDDDRKYAEKVRKKVTKISRDTVKVMLPVVAVIKEWAYSQSFEKIIDLRVNGYKIEGSGQILKEEIGKIQPLRQNEKNTGMIDIYSILIKNKGFISLISDVYAHKVGSGISDGAAKKIVESFIRTGVTVSPRMKGAIRWIYRYVYDPLFSTFMAILVFFMVIAAYRHFDLRKYSTAVITFSAVFVMLGFIPQVRLFFSGLFPEYWQGPMSSGWLMNVFSMSVFKAFAIGTGTGVVFMYIGRYWRSFPWSKNDER